MKRLKAFCKDSIVVVIYHPEAASFGEDDGAPEGTTDGTVNGTLGDAAEGAEEADVVAEVCEAGNGQFFDGVLKYGEGSVSLASCRSASK